MTSGVLAADSVDREVHSEPRPVLGRPISFNFVPGLDGLRAIAVLASWSFTSERHSFTAGSWA